MQTTSRPLGILEKIAVGPLGALGVPQLEPLVVVDSLAVHRPQPGYPPATAWLSTSHSLAVHQPPLGCPPATAWLSIGLDN